MVREDKRGVNPVAMSEAGEGFEPGNIAPPDFVDESRQPGFGLYIIDQVADEVRYVRDADGKNSLYLAKNLKVPRGK